MNIIEKFKNYSKEEILIELKKTETIEDILELDEPYLNSISNIISNKITENPKFKEICNEETIECNIFNQLKELEYTFIFHKINKTLSSNVTADKVEEGAWYRTWKEDIATIEELEELKNISNVEKQKEYVQNKINLNRETIGMNKIFEKNEKDIVEFKKATGGEPDIIMIHPKTGKISFCMANKFVNNKMEGTQDTRHLGLIFETLENISKPIDHSLFGEKFKETKELYKGKEKETNLWNNIVENHSKEELSKILNENYSISFYQHYSTTIDKKFNEMIKENDKNEILGLLNSFMFLAQNAYNTQGKYSLTNYTNINTFNPTNKENLGTTKTLEFFEKEFNNINIEEFKDFLNQYEIEEFLEFYSKDGYTIINEQLVNTCKEFLQENFTNTFEEYITKSKDKLGNNEEEIESNLLYLFDLEKNEVEELNHFKEEVISILIQYESFKNTKIKYHRKGQDRKEINGRKSNNLNTAIKIGFTRDKEFREGLFGLLVNMVKYYKPNLLDNELEYFENEDNYYKFYEKYNIGTENLPWITQKVLTVSNNKKKEELEEKKEELRDNKKELKILKIKESIKENKVERSLKRKIFFEMDLILYRLIAEEEIFIDLLEKNEKYDLVDLIDKEREEKDNFNLSNFIVEYYFSNNLENKEIIEEQIRLLKEKYNLEELPKEMEKKLEDIVFKTIQEQENIDIKELKELKTTTTRQILNKFKK